MPVFHFRQSRLNPRLDRRQTYTAAERRTGKIYYRIFHYRVASLQAFCLIGWSTKTLIHIIIKDLNYKEWREH